MMERGRLFIMIKQLYLFLSFLIVLETGCRSRSSQDGSVFHKEFTIECETQSGFGTTLVKVSKQGASLLSIESISNGKTVSRGTYSSESKVAGKVVRLLSTGVLDLPSENKKDNAPGKDLALVKITYREPELEKVVVRDYRYGRRFESAFHEAEKLFDELARVVNDGER